MERAFLDAQAVNVHVGQRIRERREARGVGRDALARDIATSPDDLAEIERGRRAATASQLANLANALEVPVSFYFMGVTAKGPSRWSRADMHLDLEIMKHIYADTTGQTRQRVIDALMRT